MSSFIYSQKFFLLLLFTNVLCSVHTESYKAVLTVQPDLPQILRGDTVILKCDIQGENWKYSLLCGDKVHDSDEKEFEISVQSTQTCKCFGSRQSGSSDWSDEVTLNASGISDHHWYKKVVAYIV